MIKIKKILALTLASVISVSAVACSSTNDTKAKSVTPSATAAPKADEKKASVNEQKFATLKNPNIAIFGSAPGTNGDQDFLVSEFEKKYGGKVTIVTEADNETNVFTMIAAGNIPDRISLNSARITTYLQKAILQPVDQYLDSKDPIFDKGINETCTWRGNVYGLGDKAVWKGIMYNKALFENNGIKTPYDSFKEGSWNWKSFKESALKLTQDTNRDGQVDIFGFATGIVDYYNFMKMNGGDLYSFVRTKTPKIDVTIKDPKSIEGIQFFQDGLVKDKSFYIAKNALDDFYNQKAAMVYTDAARPAFLPATAKFEWDFAPFPVGPQGDKNLQPGTLGRYGIPKGAKNPEGAAAYMYLSAKLTLQMREKNWKPFYEKANKSSRWDEILKWGENIYIPNDVLIGDTKTQADKSLQTDIQNGVPIQTAVEKVVPLYQTAVDQFIKTEAEAFSGNK